MARYGWRVSEAFMDSRPRWRCARCAESAMRARGSAAVRAPRSECAAPGHRISVLVVDDDEPIRRLTHRILRDFDVVTVSSGEEALKILASVRFEVIVSDVSMPGLSGPDLFERVCQLWPSLAERFVFVSGNVFTARAQLTAAARRVGEDTPWLLDKLTYSDTLPAAVLDAASRNAARSGVYQAAPEATFQSRIAG